VPEQIHINLANPSNDAVHSFSVAWATTADLNTVVKYGDSPDKLNRQVRLQCVNVHMFQPTDVCTSLLLARDD
jgi:hypothetical protein